MIIKNKNNLKKIIRETASKENWRMHKEASCCPFESTALFSFNLSMSFAIALVAHSQAYVDSGKPM